MYIEVRANKKQGEGGGAVNKNDGIKRNLQRLARLKQSEK